MLRFRGVGMMCQPGNYSPERAAEWQPWAADNGCFAATWEPGKWLDYLDRYQYAPGNLFAVVPDVVGDADATLARWGEWLPEVTGRGYRPAFVIQNGETGVGVPWSGLGAVFIGGDDAYKLGSDAYRITQMAKARDVHVHMGRVNSLRRLRLADRWGCDTVDGTFLAFGPDVNTPRLCRMLDVIEAGRQTAFDFEATA